MEIKRLRKYGSWLLVIATFIYLGYKLNDFSEWSLVMEFLLDGLKNPLLYITFLLPLLNFTMETIKWLSLLKPNVTISFKRAFGSVVGGITTGIMTPARIGEIGARLLLLKEGDRAFGGAMFVVGSLIQTSITVLLGVFALAWTHNGEWISNTLNYLILLLIFGLALWILFKFLLTFFPSYRIFELLQGYLNNIRTLPKDKLLLIIVLSFLKYFIYSIQLLIILYLFNPTMSLLAATPLVIIYYLGVTFLPGFLLADLGVRGSLALFLFSSVIGSPLFIIVPVFMLWILNSCLPALVGLLVIKVHTN